MSDHSILADKVSECLYEGMSPRETTDALLAAGVRPPARVITEPADLVDLPIGSAVVDAESVLWQLDTVHHYGHYRQPWWLETGSTRAQSTSAITMPVTVVHVPAEAKS